MRFLSRFIHVFFTFCNLAFLTFLSWLFFVVADPRFSVDQEEVLDWATQALHRQKHGWVFPVRFSIAHTALGVF